MTDNERKAVQKVSAQIAELEHLKSALELGDPSVTISAGVLKFGKYSETSFRMKEMTLALVNKLIKTKWHALAHLIGEPVTITADNQAFSNADYQFMRVAFNTSNCEFSDCNFRYMFLTNQEKIRGNIFINCDFTGAIFSHKDFVPDLRDIEFQGCIFDHAMLKYADLRTNGLNDTSWNGTYLNEAIISQQYEIYISAFKIKGKPIYE